MMKRIRNSILILFFSFFLFPAFIKAGYANISLSGGTVVVGDTITVNISVSSTDSKVTAIGGYLSYDSNYLTLNGCEHTSRLTFQSGAKIAFIDYGNVGVGAEKIGHCTFTTKAVGNTSVSLNGIDATSNVGTEVVKLSASASPAYITIKNPPSSNNNLSGLKISPGSISFNKNTTSYSTTVDSNVTSVNITASAEDSTARIEGTGSRGLNYGNNALNVIVTAENGATKTYTINVNRKDNRSGNNNLSSLSVSNGKLSPGFSKNTTSYSVEVPYEVTRLNITATAEDGKSRVDVYSPELVAEETVNGSVTVTAENGATKTYTISISRGKDPNKVLSTDNYLSDLSVSVGMLSPAFDKEKLNYAVYLPYEISYIVVDTEVSDKRYATIKKEGSNDLAIGNNLFKYTVTAEDGSTRVYTLTVVRNKSMEDVNTNTNTYLKSLKLKNGKLTTNFNKKKFVYKYTKKNNKVDIKSAIPEVEDNTVSTYKFKKGFIIIVETPTGEKGFYVLLETRNYLLLFIIVIVIILLGGITYFLIRKFKKDKKGGKSNKKGANKDEKE